MTLSFKTLIFFSIFYFYCPFANANMLDLKIVLGEKLFDDKKLSKDHGQSCSTCHSQVRAFSDPRVNVTSSDKRYPGAVSLGQDGVSLGDINTPSITYRAYVPNFHFDDNDELYKGGLFLNGRSKNLFEQAEHPLLNALEMQMNKPAIVYRVEMNYKEEIQEIFGDNVFDSIDFAFSAIVSCISAFEKSEALSNFDSIFDKVLLGKIEFSNREKQGFDLFVSEEKGNCAACHPVPKIDSSRANSLFTDFTYDNLGVPKNILVRLNNGLGENHIDNGLYDNPVVSDSSLKGAFRVPSLRNVAITAPYMHNGVFNRLDTVVHFYNSRDVMGALNPESNSLWRSAEVDSTKNTEELGDLGLSLYEVELIVDFLRTLTDERYEYLL